MKTKKMSLQNLEVTSFVTYMEKNEKQTVNGGADTWIFSVCDGDEPVQVFPAPRRVPGWVISEPLDYCRRVAPSDACSANPAICGSYVPCVGVCTDNTDC